MKRNMQGRCGKKAMGPARADGYESGRTDGFSEGEKCGLERGIEQGTERGRVEKRAGIITEPHVYHESY